MSSIANNTISKGKHIAIFMLLLANLWCQLMPLAQAISLDSANLNIESTKTSGNESASHCGSRYVEDDPESTCCDFNSVCENRLFVSSLLDLQLLPVAELYTPLPIELVYLQQQCLPIIESPSLLKHFSSKPRLHLVNCVQLN